MTCRKTAIRTILLVAGMITSLVGLASMIVPVETEAGLGIVINSEASLLNELRASGGGLAAVGGYILYGAFIAELAYSATLLATLMYLGFGFARVLSMALDGMPDPRLLQVTVVEFAIGLLCFAALMMCKRQPGQLRG